MARRKSYNPFKMWGSYLGAYALPVFVLSYLAGSFTTIKLAWPFAVLVGFAGIEMLFSSVAGFLLGWGIHSLFRKFGGRR
jgi:hypothetical protein